VRTIGDLWEIETVCLRVFNAYGPGQPLPPSHPPVIPYCLRQAMDNGTIVIHGNGEQTRDYVFIEDVIDAMVAASFAEKINRLIINVGSGKETSVNEIVKTVKDLTGTKPEIVVNKSHDSGPSRMCADLALATKKLGYHPKVNLKEGLIRIIENDMRFIRKQR